MTTAFAVIAVFVALALGYAWGRRRPSMRPDDTPRTPGLEPTFTLAVPQVTPAGAEPQSAVADSAAAAAASAPEPADDDHCAQPLALERARLLRSYESECARLRRELGTRAAQVAGLAALAAERAGLFRELEAAKRETARYRQLVIDIENSAPPPLLGGPGMPDDLKLIVGVGPVLERMLHQLGITTFRQIARWTERDIDEIDAHLSEFRGRIRRDAWVTQARALHQSTHGTPPSARERG